MRYAATLSALTKVKGKDAFQAKLIIMTGPSDDAQAEEWAMDRCRETFSTTSGWSNHNVIILRIPDEQPTGGKKVSKPVPRELVVCPVFGCLSPALRIVTSSDDAKSWIDTEAKQFGVLVSLTTMSPGSYTLYVSEAYDANDVLAYLNSYNDPAPDLA